MTGDATTLTWYVAETLNANILAWIESKLFYFAASLQAVPCDNIEPMTTEKHLMFNIICNMLQMCGNILLYLLHGRVLDMINLTRTRKLLLCRRHPTKTSNTANIFHLLHI